MSGFYKQCEDQDIIHRHVFLNRTKPYNTAGRFQTEEQAREMDNDLVQSLDRLGLSYYFSGTEEHALDNVLRAEGYSLSKVER